MKAEDLINPSDKQLRLAIENENDKFHACYTWLEKAMPANFFEQVKYENIILTTRNLIGLDLQGFFCIINIKRMAIVLCLDSADADLHILKNFANYGIQDYQCYISSSPPPFPNCKSNLRIGIVKFTEAFETVENLYSPETKAVLLQKIKERDPEISEEIFEKLLTTINGTFIRSLSLDRAALALEMFYRAQTRDNCQYEVRYNEDWEATGSTSMQIVLAWKNTPKYNFLFQLTQVVYRHKLMMKKVNATYINPYSKESILVMALDLHSANGQAAWEVADIVRFLRAFATVKYFMEHDAIDSQLLNKGIIDDTTATFLRTMADFIHQSLVHIDPNLYTPDKIKEDLCRHPELTLQLDEAFTYRFHPDLHNEELFNKTCESFYENLNKLDTGNEENDTRRKNVLKQGLSFIKHTLKTNFFRMNYTALSFRLDPAYLNDIPFDRAKKFPLLPYAIFFIRGMHFFGFHIRFNDLSRGGLRTVYLEQPEQVQQAGNNIFTECYNLAFTQHMKNKDIPEGGAKGIIFLKPGDRLISETLILQSELESAGIGRKEIEKKIDIFRKEQKEVYLYQAQRSYIESLITIINCDDSGKIRAKYIVDYHKKPEYLYLGPDENMHDSMINWIAAFSKRYGYKPGSSFISGKPEVGINHKEYGVTSLGVNVYMAAVLRYLGIVPTTDTFTVKMSGGPDGDVAGNQICNLAKFYPHTAKIIALTDISGCIYSPQGLNLNTMVDLFKRGLPLKFYPPEELSEGGFLLDKQAKRSQTAFAQQTLCWKKLNGKLIEEWMPGNEMNLLLRSHIHHAKADVFIPAGGRPRTLNETNVHDYLDETGTPTSLAIIEGANLYLTPEARDTLENLGVLIIKDSSANKTGVICSSFEVLCGLALGDEKFLENKKILVKEILERLQVCASNEANLLLRTHEKTGQNLTEITNEVSERINLYTDQLLNYLDAQPLDSN
ncbi:MAG: NAD-glutamate dehydrogenase, partial [Parachlamydiaceae bacterium]|nr:NAD-glutamate dehydrogenase [Parachlamydiaceae bacterium]